MINHANEWHCSEKGFREELDPAPRKTMSRLGFGEKKKKLLFDFRQQHVRAIYDWVDEKLLVW